MTAQAIALAVLVAVVGMPHGGLDHRFGRAILQPTLGRHWVWAFHGGYLAIMLVVLLGWLVAPLATLAVFVLLSAYHFGSADKEPGSSLGVWLTILRGGLVVWVPALAWPDEFSRLTAWVVPGERWPVDLPRQPLVQALLAVATVAAFVGSAVISPRSAVLVAALIGVCVVLPPLMSFLVYFCGWHSVRELLGLARRADPTSLTRGLKRVLVAAAPAAVGACLLAAAGWYVAGGPDRPLTPSLIQAVFIGLSVVAVPHILLTAWAQQVQADPFRTEPAVA